MPDRPAAGAPTTEPASAIWDRAVDAMATLYGNTDIRFSSESRKARDTLSRALAELLVRAEAGS